ncbi:MULTISPECIES: 2OG-Fe(II) oxygenase [unclassified Moorena]|uniref:2OG-Fe(II) oxygenase n=1 Tax=unclassified Moorena TaxID=2683338 RepID=UPI0013FED3F0|nr:MULTISPECIES: 2OG-Fe(II) oxygenase [unclassified Moorena]NEO11623.1 2OG-Fe(II) oxygenase [Moorena sp. SIO3E8]NEP99754.1 2OG-Fe(II) oxygenase [Moorena sp. SIO3F7]
MKIIVNQSYSLREKAFNPDYLQILEKEILSSPYLGASQLSESFSGTKGFSLVFKTNGIEQVKQHFPFLKPYLKTALKPTCNVFYLNPLIIKEGGKVEDHVDCSLQGYVQGRTIPDYVSVMYVKVPSDLEGGELVLKRGKFPLATIQPKENALLFFKGNLTHSVNQVKTSQVRMSLVCEQYALDSAKLKKIPEFKIEFNSLSFAYQ